MGTLAAGVAREVSAPLGAISAKIEAMRREEGHSTGTREDLSLIASQIALVTDIIADMKAFGRMDGTVKKSVSVNDVVLASLRLTSMGVNDAQIETDLDANSPRVLGDEGGLIQLVLDLIRKVRLDPPSELTPISISTYTAGAKVLIDIAQTSGVADSSSHSETDAASLDLWISQKLVSGHQGTLSSFVDERNCKRFTIALPLLEQKDAARVLTPSPF